VAHVVFGSRVVRLDGSDLMPLDVQQEFWRGTMDYVTGFDLGYLLSRIEETAQRAYP
jgi:hypothetical protein